MLAGAEVQSRNELLAALPAAELSRLLPHLKPVALAQGDILLQPGDRVQYVYFPFGGMISLLAVMRDGKAIETRIIGREGALGTLAAFSPWTAVSRAVVRVSGQGVRIAQSQFQKLVRENERLRDTVLKYKNFLVLQGTQMAACNALHGAESRLARWLLQTSDLIGSETIPLTQEALSQMLGVRRTTVTAIARSFQAIGLIRYSRGKIQILNREKLRRASCECYQPPKSRRR
jgi:CRP-like cAMP-binding protein